MVQAELRACGGRTNIRELQAIINIDSGYIASHVNAIAADNPSIHVLAAGEVVTESYLDTIADDVNVELQRRGQMTIGDVATTYQLPVPLCGTGSDSQSLVCPTTMVHPACAWCRVGAEAAVGAQHSGRVEGPHVVHGCASIPNAQLAVHNAVRLTGYHMRRPTQNASGLVCVERSMASRGLRASPLP